jgi:membrane-associated protein
MAYPRFALFNVTGGALWVLSFLLGGFFFGNVPAVKQNFHYVIVAIMVISIMPPILEYLRARREDGAAAAEKG